MQIYYYLKRDIKVVAQKKQSVFDSNLLYVVLFAIPFNSQR
jgi:hypothetical protein